MRLSERTLGAPGREIGGRYTPSKRSHMATREQQGHDRRLGLALATGVVIALIIFIFIPPEHLNSATLSVVRFLASIAAALAAYLFMGSMTLGGALPILSKLKVRA